MLVMPNGRPTVADFQSWATAEYGRNATDDELNRFASEAGISDPNNISQAQFDAAKNSARKYAASLGATPKSAQPPPPPEGGKTVPTTGSGQVVTGVPPAYQAQQFQTNAQSFPKFQPNTQLQGQRNDLMSQILRTPGTMDQTFQDQLFENQKELAQSASKQLGLQRQQNLANRGMGANGNQAQFAQAQLDENLISQLLAGRRDIATQAAIQNRADELNALQASNALQGGDIAAFEAVLRGLQAQEGAGLNAFQANENARLNQAQSQLGNAQFDFNQRDSDRARLLQEFLGRSGQELEQQKFGENKRQFDTQALLELLSFLEGKNQFGLTFGENQRQFNNQLGLNWAGQQNNNLNNLLQLFQYLGA